MAEIEIRLQSETSGAETSPAQPLFLLAGVLGLALLLRGVRGISFSLWAVCPGAVLFCGGLWYARKKGPRATAAALGGLVILCAAGALLFRDELAAQFHRLGESLSSGSASGDVTGAVLLLTAGTSALLFAGECLFSRHRPFVLLAALLPPLWAAAGFRVSWWALALLALFVGGFSALRGQRGGAGIPAALLIFAAFLLAWPAAARFSEALSLPAYRAEELAFQALQGLSGTARNPYSGGGVSRGNHYQTGTVQLELSAARRPEEPVYLRGFSGGEYAGGRWLPAEDDALLEQVRETLGWGRWGNTVNGLYQTMFYVINQYVPREETPQPITLTIRGGENFTPYYSRPIHRGIGEGGYPYQFYEPKDMLLDWEQVPDSFSRLRDWNRIVYEAYAAEAAAAYTRVPAERVPRLARLAAEHPLTDLEEITAFILQVLKENAAYSQTPGWTPVGEEVVEDFLFEKHSGYCVHYASAAVLLYRLYGIPARYAAGYLVPPEAFSLGEDGNWEAAVTDASAHAWAEVFLPDYGWTPVEVTPNSQGEIAVRYPGFSWSTAEQEPAPLPAPEREPVSPAQNHGAAPGQRAGNGTHGCISQSAWRFSVSCPWMSGGKKSSGGRMGRGAGGCSAVCWSCPASAAF